MLFGGYGVSRRMRPYHAGMLGVDSLIVLDEAHLVPPFERLMEAIASGRDARGRLLGPEPDVDGVAPPLRLLPLSATGRARVGALELSDADRKHPVVKQRLAARKRVSLRAEVSPRDLAEALTREAWALAEAGAKPVRCIVYCNRRDDAAKVQAALQARRKQAGVERIDVGLLVGARRLFERQQAARWLEERGFFAGHRGPLACSTFVIATSAGEVGVDLDADHMVCDLVAWERMVQRLGRVNRRGEGDASIVVVAATAEDDESDRLVAVRALLDELPRFRKGELDASPGALTALRERARRKPALAELVVQASTPPDLHPPLSRPTVEAWSMTSIETHAGRPEAEPWIRGWHEEEAPQTAVAWRKHLPVTDRGRLIDKVALETFREGAPLKPAAARISDTSGCRLLEASSAVPGERWTGSSRASTREQPRGSSRRYAQRTSAHGGMTSGGLRGGGCGGATWPWCALPSIRIILRLMRPNRMSCHGMKVRKKRTAREGRGAKNSRE
jgi:CRISPR-associated endonuclease/helicase Cas3